MGISAPLQNAQPTGLKLPANILISPKNGLDIYLSSIHLPKFLRSYRQTNLSRCRCSGRARRSRRGYGHRINSRRRDECRETSTTAHERQEQQQPTQDGDQPQPGFPALAAGDPETAQAEQWQQERGIYRLTTESHCRWLQRSRVPSVGRNRHSDLGRSRIDAFLVEAAYCTRRQTAASEEDIGHRRSCVRSYVKHDASRPARGQYEE